MGIINKKSKKIHHLQYLLDKKEESLQKHIKLLDMYRHNATLMEKENDTLYSKYKALSDFIIMNGMEGRVKEYIQSISQNGNS